MPKSGLLLLENEILITKMSFSINPNFSNNPMSQRSLICSMLGHVDHGKSSLLDSIRGTKIVNEEEGGITQTIGASFIPFAHIKKLAGHLMKLDAHIPGLLFIDTPGHEAFTNLRKRGGNLSDIAVLVIDIIDGIKPQTKEAIGILKAHKTPFIIAANKIDRIQGWKSSGKNLVTTISQQAPEVQQQLDTLMYKIVGELFEKEKIQTERFDRIDDFTKSIAIIPVSAHTKDGIPELLMVLLGLCQRFLQQKMEVNVTDAAKGTILEVKEVKGQGTVIDAIIYDGCIKKNDIIIIGGITEPIETKVRNIFLPEPLLETRYASAAFKPVDQADAAVAVRIFAPNLKGVVGGMPLRSCKQSEVELVKEQIQEEIEEVVIETEDLGVIVKADTLGSLEALTRIIRQAEIPIRQASIGEIKKVDIVTAKSNREKEPVTGAILAFNVVVTDEIAQLAAECEVKIINSGIIYSTLDQYKEWKIATQKAIEAKALDKLNAPCKIQIMEGYVFRQSNPAVVGAEIIEGRAKVGTPLMKEDGNTITRIKEIQKDQKNVPIAIKGETVAISLPGVTMGRRLMEGEFLYSDLTEEEFKTYKDYKQFLTPDEKAAIQKIAEIKRTLHPTWGL